MKTVPSLVASSTVGVAAAGLALGKPEHSTSPRPSSRKRKPADLADLNIIRQGTSSPASRPGSSTTVIIPDNRHSRPIGSILNPPIIHQHPSIARIDGHNSNGGRRLSIVKIADFPSAYESSGDEPTRDSVSSRGSWIRRLSIITNSHSNSPRSSVGPDSPSLNLSHGSAAPILSNPASSPTQLPPNKLVKRATSGRAVSGPVTRSGSRPQVPTLRRPATSHQRSVTLQQQFREDLVVTRDSVQERLSKQQNSTPLSKFSTLEFRSTWRHFFESRPTKLTKERTSGDSSDGDIQKFQPSSRRVILDETVKPTLVKPDMITPSKDNGTVYYDACPGLEDAIDDDIDEIMEEKVIPSIETSDELQKRTKRSLSMHFSSPASWITRSGSLRGNRRNAAESRSGGMRYSSAPVSTMQTRSTTSAHGPISSRHRPIMDPAVFQRQAHAFAEIPSPSDPFASSFHAQTRNISSPLPPLSRLSSFNIDLARLRLSSSSSSAARRSPTTPLLQTNTAATSVYSKNHASPTSPSYCNSRDSKIPRTSEIADRASTLVSSDNDAKGYTFGDEDDLDFQSETVFDSLRSGATGSMRSHNTPLDSMFDESPPSMNGHSKNKRLSIHEMLVNGGFQEDNNRIVEEDEGMSTPVKGSRSSPGDNFETPVQFDAMNTDDAFPLSPPSLSLATKDFGRLLIDDDEEDEDWTREDENNMGNQLSPPSSMNSRKVSPNLRAALADVTHSGTPNGNSAPTERLKSNLFDWSEPSSADKLDYMGNSPRPKTAHVKHLADGRGGRTTGRKGPSPLHVRSQSVPVVPDVTGQREHSKLTPKFGTWGLGAKGVSEDWDNDFEFENPDADDVDDGNSKMEMSGMLVPPAIQASQASVVGHVGQIREVCLLVEDLKRLRQLAKEKGLLNGASAPLWKEAEGIIALAVPDEEDLTLSSPHSPSSIGFDQELSEDKYHERGPDVEDVFRPDFPFEVLNRRGRPTGFVYDGNTVRRRSVFSPEDDIFGAGALSSPPIRDHLRPPSTSPRHSSMKSSSEIARSVMETMHQHRSTSDPLIDLASQSSNKMPFDTTSLRDLVNRASLLSRTLGDLIRKADGGTESPEVNPKCESSPAFTRVFTDPMASPPKNLLRTQSNNSILGGSVDTSPTRSLGQRMHMMTVV